MRIEWETTGQDLRSAKARLLVGGTAYLSVERLGATGWDWLVWDASGQVQPRYGLASTEHAAKQQAEAMMAEVDATLCALSESLPQDAAA